MGRGGKIQRVMVREVGDGEVRGGRDEGIMGGAHERMERGCNREGEERGRRGRGGGGRGQAEHSRGRGGESRRRMKKVGIRRRSRGGEAHKL